MSQIGWQDLGVFLSRIRRRTGLSQEKLADQVGVTRQHIWRIEHGCRRPSKHLFRSLLQICPPTQEELVLKFKFEQMIDGQA